MNSFFSLIFRQKYITRWGLMRNITPESLSTHSAEVAVIAHALGIIGNRYFGKSYDPNRLAAAALFHDAAEVFTGDMPTPVKYFSPEMRENYAVIEENATEKLLAKLPADMAEDYRGLFEISDEGERKLIRAADKLAAYIKCIEEGSCGNREFLRAEEATLKSLKKLSCPECDYFIEHFIPPFAESIDDM